MKVDKLYPPANFIILDMEEDRELLIILGRSFLANANTLIDVRQDKLTLREQNDEVTFNMSEAVNYPKDCFRVDKVKEHTMEISVTKESPRNVSFSEESICTIETPATSWYADSKLFGLRHYSCELSYQTKKKLLSDMKYYQWEDPLLYKHYAGQIIEDVYLQTRWVVSFIIAMTERLVDTSDLQKWK